MKSKRTFYTLYFLLLVVIYTCSSCSANYHLKQAIKKDPSLFDTTTTITRVQIKLPPVNFSFDCAELMKAKPITLYAAREYTDPVSKKVKNDSAKVVITPVLDANNKPTGEVDVSVECPDVEIITIDREVLVEVPIPLTTKLKLVAIGMVIGMVIGMILLIGILNYAHFKG